MQILSQAQRQGQDRHRERKSARDSKSVCARERDNFRDSDRHRDRDRDRQIYTHARAHTEARARAHAPTRTHAHVPERHVCEGCCKYVGDLFLSACFSFSSSPFPISPVCPAASSTAFEMDCRLVLVGVDILRICKNMFYESMRAVNKPYMCLVKDILLCHVSVS